MNHSIIKYILIAAATAVMPGCSGNGDDAKDSDAAIEAAHAQGTADAEAVCLTPENSMEREYAILHIRSKETQLRNEGYDECADAYAGAAEKVLVDSLIITLQ